MADGSFLLYHETMKGVFAAFNNNPTGRNVGDCSVRAVSVALGVDWDTAFDMLAHNAKEMGDMPSSDSVWGSVLRQHGFTRHSVPNRCPDCYTAEAFAYDHPVGIYVLGFGGHVATIYDGSLYDSWDSSQEIPQYYWKLEE